MPPRDVSGLIQRFRAFLMGREYVQALRFQDFIASRSPNPPKIPDGPSHKLHTNYYCTRDPRREVKPPLVIADTQKMISPGKTSESKSLPTPGQVYRWD